MALMVAAGQVVASAVLDPLLDRAIGAAANEFKLIRGVHKEVQKLTLTLTLLKRVLDDAEARQVEDSAILHWLRDLQQVFLDADDLLDEYATDAALQVSMGAAEAEERHNKVWHMMFHCFTHCISQPMARHATAHQICEINCRLDYLMSIKKQFDLQVSSAENSRLESSWRRPQTSSLLPSETSVIGRNTEKEQIIQVLLSSTHEIESSNNVRNFSVLPIVGMGGLGKTTLAQLVFNDQRVKNHFGLTMWVCVSNNFDPIRLTKAIIEVASGESCQFHELESMQQKLRQQVEGKTFLLVLDDVWEVDRSEWENLLKPLEFANKGSRVLVTSRYHIAVDINRGRMVPITLQGLSEDDFWLLFKTYAFAGSSDYQFLHLEEMGRQIVKRLGGLPLAAKTIGCLLNTRLDLKHWREVEKSEILGLQQDKHGLLPALTLSYQYLDKNLKQCFAYCSLFPEDYNFSKTELTQLWDAQCFSGISAECFDNLVSRSFLEPSGYVMHDLTHDLAEYVSKDDCFRWEDRKHKEILPDTVRHISVYVTEFDQRKMKELLRHEKLRTLLIFSESIQLREFLGRGLDELFLKLKRLRVLGLSGCGITELPESVGGLRHLRYIDLSDNYNLQNLPNSMCNLHNLQVLKLTRCSALRVLPTRMCDLINLRHLVVDSRRHEMVSRIDGLGKLTGLQELAVAGRKVKELGGMVMLRDLEIVALEEVGTKDEAIEARLENKEHLRVLNLKWRSESGGSPSSINREVEEEVLQAFRPVDTITTLSISGYGGAKSPGWMGAPTTWPSFCLQHVELSDCTNWEALPSLGQLRLLKTLNISRMPNLLQMPLDPPFFPSLEVLLIDGLPQWEGWGCVARNGEQPPQQKPPSPPLFPFPRPRYLCIKNCPKLRELPPLPPTLETLVLDQVGLMSLPGLWGDGEVSSSHSPSTSALSKLTIEGCPNMTSISGLLQHHLTTLKDLRICDCGELLSLPKRGFGHLISLKHLYISRCPGLTCPAPSREEEEDAPPLSLPSSLEELSIMKCGDAMGGWWWLGGLHRLTSLAKLKLSGCPNTVASFFFCLGNLHHQQQAASSLTHLAIKFCGCDHQLLESSPSTAFSLPSHPPQVAPAAAGGFRALTSLRLLKIFGSPNLMRKLGGGGLPSSLVALSINGDNHLDDECLSTCLRVLTSLRWLTISHCKNLRSLPATLGSLPSLEELEIESCDGIQSLPETGLPGSLRKLEILGCPALAQRCSREQGGPEWPKISHIPNVLIRY